MHHRLAAASLVLVLLEASTAEARDRWFPQTVERASLDEDAHARLDAAWRSAWNTALAEVGGERVPLRDVELRRQLLLLFVSPQGDWVNDTQLDGEPGRRLAAQAHVDWRAWAMPRATEHGLTLVLGVDDARAGQRVIEEALSAADIDTLATRLPAHVSELARRVDAYARETVPVRVLQGNASDSLSIGDGPALPSRRFDHHATSVRLVQGDLSVHCPESPASTCLLRARPGTATIEYAEHPGSPPLRREITIGSGGAQVRIRPTSPLLPIAAGVTSLAGLGVTLWSLTADPAPPSSRTLILAGITLGTAILTAATAHQFFPDLESVPTTRLDVGVVAGPVSTSGVPVSVGLGHAGFAEVALVLPSGAMTCSHPVTSERPCRFAAVPPGPATLVVRTPEGRWELPVTIGEASTRLVVYASEHAGLAAAGFGLLTLGGVVGTVAIAFDPDRTRAVAGGVGVGLLTLGTAAVTWVLLEQALAGKPIVRSIEVPEPLEFLNEAPRRPDEGPRLAGFGAAPTADGTGLSIAAAFTF